MGSHRESLRVAGNYGESQGITGSRRELRGVAGNYGESQGITSPAMYWPKPGGNINDDMMNTTTPGKIKRLK